MYGALIAPSSPVHGGKPSSSGRKPPSTFARAASRVSPQFVLLVLFNVSILFYFHYHPVALPDPPALLEGAAFTSFTSNRHGSDHHHHIGSNGLSAASHKNDSSLATPDISTMTCELCIAEPSHPLCVYGLDNIRLSRAYEGSGHRVRKVIEKALRGEVVEISLIGASVSAGTGIPYRESSQGAQQWQNWFMEDFKRLFPKTVLHLGILPGMGSHFFSYCFGAIVPRTSDLYLIELDINNDPFQATMDSDDVLLRGLLGLPQEPAVMRIQVFSLIFPELTRGHTSSITLAQWFDVPVISIRNFLLPHLMQHEDKIPLLFGRIEETPTLDTRHIGYRSHKAMGDMLALYMRQQVCEVKRRQARPPPVVAEELWPIAEDLGKVPRLRPWNAFYNTPPSDPITPDCQVASSTLRPMIPTAKTGDWHMESWNNKKAWASTEVGAKISMEFKGSRVGVFVWQSNGIGNTLQPGRARCSVVGLPDVSNVVDSYVDRGHGAPAFIMIAESIPYGSYTVECETLQESSTTGNEIRIMGVATY